MNRLIQIAQRTRQRIEQRKTEESLEALKERVLAMGPYNGPSFEEALRKPGLSLICEVKKASPSKGLIAPDFPYLKIAREYEACGASAISCLTEPYYFLGSDRYLREITQTVRIPVLRKDFTVDPYMIYEARALGASAVLLICAILTDEELYSYRILAESLGLSALVETHNAEEVERAMKSGAKIIGVNNRDLTTFEVNLETTRRLADRIAKDRVFVSESGIRNAEDLRFCKECGADGVLIGEMLMRSKEPGELVKGLIE